ncbi:MAG: hypothetical protein RMJ55_10765 [Roseiflexaceae bacterium]|nr:hypothetical protein [Roseiflexaceae bacterium]
MVISPDPSAVVEHIQEAAIQLRGETTPPQLAPPEFAWIIDVRIPEPTNPLARAASVADLLDLLGAYGLKRDDLARVKELRLYA